MYRTTQFLSPQSRGPARIRFDAETCTLASLYEVSCEYILHGADAGIRPRKSIDGLGIKSRLLGDNLMVRMVVPGDVAR